MEVTSLSIPDVKLLRPKKIVDDRGYFSEVYNVLNMRDAGIDLTFIQDNHVYSAAKGVVRGLHFQLPPYAQAKLVRVVRGAIFDVAVDIRRNSPTFGKQVSAIISAADWTQIFVPVGFAHGYCTIEPHTEVLYKVSNYYSPLHDRGMLWNDPHLKIPWPVPPDRAELSDRDWRQPRLQELTDCFP
jgi:dTDP-4-dehydrorhamnose 3,5-epimerase